MHNKFTISKSKILPRKAKENALSTDITRNIMMALTLDSVSNL